MGVISCRRIEASLIPNYVRVQATTKCYCSKQGTKNRGRQKGIPGMRKSLLQAVRLFVCSGYFTGAPTPCDEVPR